MAKVVVSVGEAAALRRFRNSADSQEIKAVLMRELKLTREDYESNVASEETRMYIAQIKRTLALLFEDELIRGE